MNGAGRFYRFIGRVAGILLPSLLGLVAALFMGEATTAMAGGLDDAKAAEQAKMTGDYDEVIRLYTKAIVSGELTKEDLEASFNNRGTAWSRKKEYYRAIADYNEALNLNPRNAGAYNNRCWARGLNGSLEEALADCTKSLLLRPGDANTYNSRGLVQLKSHKYAEAIADYYAALQDTKDASSLYGRGLARRLMGDTTGADADIAAALKIDPTVATTYKLYGVSSN